MTSSDHLQDEALVEPKSRTQSEHLQGCASCRQRRETQDRVRVSLRALDREAAVSPQALAMLQEASTSGRASRRRWTAAVAATLVVAAALAGVARRADAPQGPLSAPLRDELALDHLHYAPLRAPAQVASSDSRVVAAALEERLGRPVVVPTWEATTLIGGRSCRIQSEWVPLVLYERAGRRISFFELPSAQLSRVGCDRGEGGLSICATARPGGGAFVAVADLPAHELARLLDLVPSS